MLSKNIVENFKFGILHNNLFIPNNLSPDLQEQVIGNYISFQKSQQIYQIIGEREESFPCSLSFCLKELQRNFDGESNILICFDRRLFPLFEQGCQLMIGDQKNEIKRIEKRNFLYIFLQKDIEKPENCETWTTPASVIRKTWATTKTVDELSKNQFVETRYFTFSSVTKTLQLPVAEMFGNEFDAIYLNSVLTMDKLAGEIKSLLADDFVVVKKSALNQLTSKIEEKIARTQINAQSYDIFQAKFSNSFSNEDIICLHSKKGVITEIVVKSQVNDVIARIAINDQVLEGRFIASKDKKTFGISAHVEEGDEIKMIIEPFLGQKVNASVKIIYEQ